MGKGTNKWVKIGTKYDKGRKKIILEYLSSTNQFECQSIGYEISRSVGSLKENVKKEKTNVIEVIAYLPIMNKS